MVLSLNDAVRKRPQNMVVHTAAPNLEWIVGEEGTQLHPLGRISRKTYVASESAYCL